MLPGGFYNDVYQNVVRDKPDQIHFIVGADIRRI